MNYNNILQNQTKFFFLIKTYNLKKYAKPIT